MEAKFLFRNFWFWHVGVGNLVSNVRRNSLNSRLQYEVRKSIIDLNCIAIWILWLFFRFLRLTASQPLYPDFPAPRVLRLGIQHDPAAWMDQYSLRRILLSIRNLHGPGYTPRHFVGLFDAATADRQIIRLFESEFGPLCRTRRGGQGCTASIKGNYTASASPFSFCHSFDTLYGGCCRIRAALWNTVWDSRKGTVCSRQECSRDFSVSKSIRHEASRQ